MLDGLVTRLFIDTTSLRDWKTIMRQVNGNQDNMSGIENSRRGNMRWGLIALLLGLPIPVVLLATLFVGGCR